MEISKGAIVRTNYGTGPYEITEVQGPCICPEYIASLDATYEKPAPPSHPHYHFICKELNYPKNRRPCDNEFYLGGYRLDGTSVWDRDRLIIEGFASEVQLELFEGVSND